MVRVGYNLMMVAIIQVNGKITKCMGMANYTIKMDRSHIREIGKAINFAALVEYSMINLKNLWNVLTIMILLI